MHFILLLIDTVHYLTFLDIFSSCSKMLWTSFFALKISARLRTNENKLFHIFEVESILFCSRLKLNTLNIVLSLPQRTYLTIFKPLSLFFCLPIDSKRYFYTCQLLCFVHILSYHLTVLPKSMKTWRDTECINANYLSPFASIFKTHTIHIQKNFRLETGHALVTSFRGACKWTINFTTCKKQKRANTRQIFAQFKIKIFF